jgi:hypothetical protein
MKYVSSVIFVHINKTGGSSIEHALQLPFQHRTARELYNAMGDRRWRSRFSFAFVRNPWDKVASHYHYRVKTNQTGLRDKPVAFNDWVQLTYGDGALPYYDKPKMFLPQTDWITNERGEVMVDFVGRFERLADDFREVYARGALAGAALPHLKQSVRGDYRKLYSDEAAEIVGRWFAKDLDLFGYRFE